MKYAARDALLEYNDRVARYNEILQDVKTLDTKKQALTEDKNRVNAYMSEVNELIQSLRMKKNQLNDNIENNATYPAGVRAIVNASSSIAGYHGVLGDLLEAKEGYETAVQTALGSSSHYIVMKDDASARHAIQYLKNNRAGRATFLPMATMKARSVKEDALTVIQTMEGYLGVAADFILSQPKYKSVIASQIGNVLVAKDLPTANQLSHYTYARYKVVTLDGDVVNVGGSMTGGAYRQSQNQSLSSLKKELEKTQVELSQQEAKLIELRQQDHALDNDLLEVNNSLLQKQISRGQLEEIVRSKLSKYKAAKAEFEAVSHEKMELLEFKSDDSENEVIVQLNSARAKVDDLTQTIQSKRLLRTSYVEENEGYGLH